MGSKESRDPYSSCGEAARASGNTGKKKNVWLYRYFITPREIRGKIMTKLLLVC